jgi:hypothetical protein
MSACVAVLAAFVIPYGLPWSGIWWASLLMFGTAYVVARSPRPMGQVIAEVESEPLHAAAGVPPPRRRTRSKF